MLVHDMVHLTMPNQKSTVSRNKRLKKIKNDQPCFAIDIRGDLYNVYLHPEKELLKIIPDAAAFMNFEKKEIRFCEEGIEITTILHELVHCFIASTYIHELQDLSKDDFEEIICEVVSRNYVILGDLANKVKFGLENELENRKLEGAK